MFGYLMRKYLPRDRVFDLFVALFVPRGEAVDHVFLIIGSDKGTRYTSGACVHANGPVAGECQMPAHAAVAAKIMLNGLHREYPDLDELIERSRAYNEAAGRSSNY